jgi:F0F1-type ATP synthase assembly protein I
MTQSVPHLVSALVAERRAALRVVARQAGVALAMSLLVAPWGIGAAASVLKGAAVGLVATSVFAWVLFRNPEGTSPARVAWSLYLGQALKVALTIGLLAVVFRSRVPAPWAVLAGYLATHVAYWLAPKGPANRWVR